MNDLDKLARIAQTTAHAFGTTYVDMVQGSKHAEARQARAVAMWIAAQLLPSLQKKHIAQGLGRHQGEAVGDAMRRMLEAKARRGWFWDKASALHQRLETELGVSEVPPKVSKKRDDAPIPPGSGHEVNWGFQGHNSGTKDYLEAQNKKFTEAMLKAGMRLGVAGAE